MFPDQLAHKIGLVYIEIRNFGPRILEQLNHICEHVIDFFFKWTGDDDWEPEKMVGKIGSILNLIYSMDAWGKLTKYVHRPLRKQFQILKIH